MKIALFSDSHDHTNNLAAALVLIKERDITQGIHLGDFCSQAMVDTLTKSGFWLKEIMTVVLQCQLTIFKNMY